MQYSRYYARKIVERVASDIKLQLKRWIRVNTHTAYDLVQAKLARGSDIFAKIAL